MINFPNIQSPVQSIIKNELIELSILREDLLHPEISGNKYRKLKYNLLDFQQKNYTSVLTFGGAYSNHIAAVAAAGKEFNFETIGIIRGQEIKQKLDQNPTLNFAQNCGMKLYFITREQYRDKTDLNFINSLKEKFGNFYLVPEGGTNDLAIKGCEEILGNHTQEFDIICTAVGTGGTISGLINASKSHQTILGFPALKNSSFLIEEIQNYTHQTNWKLIQNYHFGGYGKISHELICFLNDFKKKYNVPLDPIYTGKMMYGVFQLIKQNHFPSQTKILTIHTGGLQGIEGINKKLKQQNKNYLI